MTTGGALLGLIVLGCAGIGGHGGAAATPASSGGVVAELKTDKTIYRPGEPIVLTLRVTNRTDGELRLRFRSGQRYDFRIQDADGRIVWQWSRGRVFTAALGSVSLGAGETRAWSDRFEGDLRPGTYRVTGTVTAEEPIPATTAIEVR